MTTKSRPSFSVSTDGKFFGKLKRNLVNHIERKVGLFTEVIGEDGQFTFRVDFNLGNGFFYGWLISDMIKEQDGIDSLMWIMSKDFPQEIKKYILKLMVKHELVDEDTLEALEAAQED